MSSTSDRWGDNVITITLDTNVDAADLASITSAIEGRSFDIRYTSVTIRERPGLDVEEGPVREGLVWGESRWGEGVFRGAVPESALPDESRVGEAVLGGDASLLEQIIEIVSSGSFPRRGSREHVSPGARRHLRDAMILEAHAREGRDIFVTRDERGFIRDGKRERLEGMLHTLICTPAEVHDVVLRLEPT